MWSILGKFLYDALLQILGTTWAHYLRDHGAPGRLVRDAFFNQIYEWSAIILIFVTLISCLLYYFYFNKRFGKYYSRKSWFKWMFFTALIVGILTFIVGSTYLDSFSIPTLFLLVWQSLINFGYAKFLFLGISILFQLISIIVRRISPLNLSPMGNRTPF